MKKVEMTNYVFKIERERKRKNESEDEAEGGNKPNKNSKMH